MPADYDKLFRPAENSDSPDDDAGQTFFDPNASFASPPIGNGEPAGNGDAAPAIDWSQPISPLSLIHI